MLLKSLLTRNRPFLEAAITLHQAGEIPANSYLLDLDTMTENARFMSAEATRLGLDIFAMTKQIGRNPPAFGAIKAGGIDRFVAVDMACARSVAANGHRVGHLGHLSQIPRFEAATAAVMRPDYWTVFNAAKAVEAARAAHDQGYEQALLARVHAPGDTFYSGHEGGFDVATLEATVDALNETPGGRFAGLTTFPALLYDQSDAAVSPTPNLSTLHSAAERLAQLNLTDIAINAPGTTSSHVMARLADGGATQVEPGHGLTGSTPLHAVAELPERPAMLYLTEVSHLHQGRAYCFGGGLYIDPVFDPYPLKAFAGPDPETALSREIDASIPEPAMIDYYGQLHPERGQQIKVGDTVIFGFRAQAFITRAYVTPIAGVASGNAQVKGVWSTDGREAAWRN
jgi:predicted amino acid racemase